MVLLFLFLFSAFRFKVGCDWAGYLYQFMASRGLDLERAWSGREPLWWTLLMLQSQSGLSYPWVNVWSSAIFFTGVHALARRQPDPLGFLVLLFPVLIINLPMSGIRQGAAIGVMCVAFCAFLDRRLLKFIVLVVLASMIHSSAIIFLLLSPLVNGGYSRDRLILSALVAIPGLLAMMSSGSAELAVSRYVDSGTEAAGALFRTFLLCATAIFFLMFLRRNWIWQFPFDYKLVHIGALMMVFVFLTAFASSVIGDRIGYYLIPIQTIIFTRIPYFSSYQRNNSIKSLPYILLLIYFTAWSDLSLLFNKCYIPYNSWLFFS